MAAAWTMTSNPADRGTTAACTSATVSARTISMPALAGCGTVVTNVTWAPRACASSAMA
jgi:hypothetical protein